MSSGYDAAVDAQAELEGFTWNEAQMRYVAPEGFVRPEKSYSVMNPRGNAYPRVYVLSEADEAEHLARLALLDGAANVTEGMGKVGERLAPGILEKAITAEHEYLKVKHEGKRRFMSELAGFGLFDDKELFTIGSFERGYSYEPLIEGVLERGSIAMLYADSYIGKSYVALDWALSIATGAGYWAGCKVSPGKVLYLAMEGVNTLEKRWQAWQDYKGFDLSKVDNFVIYPKVVDLMNTDSVDLMVDRVKNAGFDLIVVDMVRQAIGGADENSATDVGAFMRSITEIREANPGATVLFVHHSKKDLPREYRGSTVFYGAADIVWNMLRVDESEKGKADPRRKMVCTKYKSESQPPADIVLEFLSVGPDSVLDAGSAGDVYQETLDQMLKDGLHPSQAELATQIVAKTGANLKTTKNKISDRVTAGTLDKSSFRQPGKPSAK